jgi:hypothetical protein
MRRPNLLWLVLVLACAGSACGGGQSEVEERADEAARGAEEAARGLEEMARGLGALAGGDADVTPVEPVSFRDLQTAFTELDGWEMGKPTGERMGMPVNFSQASVAYTRGDARIEAKIVDSGFNQILLAPYTMFLTAGYERETESGFEKSTQVAGYPGWERWSGEAQDGDLNAVVGRRFLVMLEGHGAPSTSNSPPVYAAATRRRYTARCGPARIPRTAGARSHAPRITSSRLREQSHMKRFMNVAVWPTCRTLALLAVSVLVCSRPAAFAQGVTATGTRGRSARAPRSTGPRTCSSRDRRASTSTTPSPGSIAFGSWNNNQHPGVPNNPGIGYSLASPGHRVFLTGSYSREYFRVGATTVAFVWESRTIGNASYTF